MKTHFFLLGFSDHPELQCVLFAVFLSIYSVNCDGKPWDDFINHSQSLFAHPMYLFLLILSFIDPAVLQSLPPSYLWT